MSGCSNCNSDCTTNACNSSNCKKTIPVLAGLVGCKAYYDQNSPPKTLPLPYQFLQTGINFPLQNNKPINDITYNFNGSAVKGGYMTSLINSACDPDNKETLTITYSTALSGSGTSTNTPSWITWSSDNMQFSIFSNTPADFT